MGLVDVLWLFSLSRIMFDFHANSQPQCITGWFGPNCKYRCRCTNDACDTDGRCTGVNICRGGWFGPACQYADLAYNRGDPPEISDEDDRTCVTAASGRPISLNFNNSHNLNWLRLRFRSSGSVNDLQVIYKNSSQIMTPTRVTNITVDQVTLDMHILLLDTIDEISFIGAGANSLCSVYVSGGRNVALKEAAAQSSTYVETSQNTSQQRVAFTADKAVDGNTNRHLYQGRGCSHTAPNQTGLVSFSVSFSQPWAVTRYVLYTSVDDRGDELRHFVSQSADNSSSIVHTFIENSDQQQPVYTWAHPSLSVSRVNLYNGLPGLHLAICELEVYGDSDCELGMYGRECELVCNCPVNVSCYASTGGCSSGCPAGFIGADCKTHCDSGHYGSGCLYTCSAFCAKDALNHTACNSTDGTCLLGCVGGLMGPACTLYCPPNTFGVGCAENCSDLCVKDTIRGETCVHTNGSCMKGCVDGYTGPTCATLCPHHTYGHECASDCSDFCIQEVFRDRPCLHTDGTCTHGCVNGYTGSTCSTKCTIGRYGKGCTFDCSRYCVPPNSTDTARCKHVDGACLHGCLSGYIGSLCQESLPETLNLSPFTLVLGVFILVAVVLCLPFCLWRKRKPPVRDGRASEEVRRIAQVKNLQETSAPVSQSISKEDVQD